MKINYGVYRLSPMEFIEAAILFLAIAFAISYLFYDSMIPMIFMMPIFIYVLKLFKNYKSDKRRKNLYQEFKDMIQSLSAGMEAGYSFEKAFDDTYKEMVRLHGADSDISKELNVILRGIKLNENAEDLLEDFGKRSGIQDISDFTQVISVAKRTGGNMVKIMKRTAENINEKLEVENEIDTVITAKKYEQKIMTIMPFFIILYLRIGNDGYMDILYQGLAGRMVMTVCLAACVVSFYWSQKIVNIGV